MFLFKGFRMTVGNPTITEKNNGTNPGLAYTCLQTILTRGYETPDFPKQPCPAGIMVRCPRKPRIPLPHTHSSSRLFITSLLAGTARIPTALITSHTCTLPRAATFSKPGPVLPRTQSASRKSLTKLCGTPLSLQICGRKMAHSHLCGRSWVTVMVLMRIICLDGRATVCRGR